MTTATTAIDVGRVLDEGRWGAYQRWLVFLTSLTIVFDGVDNQLLGIVIPTIMREWDVPRSAFAPIVSLGYLGMMIGGALAGLAGDRVGRKVALLGSMVVFGVMTLAAAAAGSPSTLGVLRLLAGIGLGGAMPNAAALAAEYVPLRRRAIAVTVTIVCVPLGATLAGLLGLSLLPIVGWRLLFVVGGLVPLVAVPLLLRALPESPRYLVRHPARRYELARTLRRMGHPVDDGATFIDPGDKGTGRPSIGSLFLPDLRADTIALWGAMFSCLLAVYCGFSWLTALLTGAGFDPAGANSGITAFNLGGVAGALLGGVAITRFGSRTAMLTMCGGAIGGALVLSTMSIAPGATAFAVMVMLTLTGGCINGVQTTMFALAAHVYPGSVRATGVGTAVAFGRSGAILSGYAGSWAIGYQGSASFFGLIALSMCVTLASLAMIRRHIPGTRGL